MRKRYKGFTLAEVLITLGIIGIVAAMTIPTLMNKTNEKENISAWKKDYSVVSQAWMTIVQENGGEGTISANTGTALNDDYGNALIAKMKVSKVCTASSTEATNAECWHKSNEWTTLNKNPISSNYSTNFSAVLNDGTYIVVGGLSANCPNDDIQCLYVGVDVNGAKRPNVQGRDIFFLGTMGGGRSEPHSISRDASDSSDAYNCVETSASAAGTVGQGCSKLALYCGSIDYTTGRCKT